MATGMEVTAMEIRGITSPQVTKMAMDIIKIVDIKEETRGHITTRMAKYGN